MSPSRLAKFIKFRDIMLEIKRLDPAEYERLLAECWRMAAKNHKRKTPAQLAKWMRGAS